MWFYQTAAMMNLTEGAILIMSKPEQNKDSDFKPVLQIMDIRLVTDSDSPERYRMILSDGTHTQQGMLATQRNGLVRSQRLKKHRHNPRLGDVYENSIVFKVRTARKLKEEFKVIFCLDELQILVNGKEAYNNFLLSVEPLRALNKGMGIPFGKLSLNIALGGFRPSVEAASNVGVLHVMTRRIKMVGS